MKRELSQLTTSEQVILRDAVDNAGGDTTSRRKIGQLVDSQVQFLDWAAATDDSLHSISLPNGTTIQLPSFKRMFESFIVNTPNPSANNENLINDTATSSTTQTYSINRIISLIGSSISALTNGAPGALDTIRELSNALGDNPDFAAQITVALTKRVRTDIANQSLSLTEKQNARVNIDAYGSVEIGDLTVDLAAVFNSGLR